MLRRIIFWVYFYATVCLGLLGLMVVQWTFGFGAMFAAVCAIVVVSIWLEHRTPLYPGEGEVFRLGGNRPPSLPPPGKQALPPPGAPQIGRSQRPALPGPKR